MNNIISIFIFFFILRLISLSFSIRNEKQLIKKGAKQHGKFNSLLLTLAHIAYYFGALYESYTNRTYFNNYSLLGVIVMSFAYIMLFYVMYKLRDIWTVKLYVLPNQRIERSLLFRIVRHPNYFLNIIPELLGVALLCNSCITFFIGFPVYLCLLLIRIKQEERAMEGMLDKV